MLFQSDSSQKTEEIGAEIARKISGGDVVLLYGELGAGKSALAKGLAKGLGVKNKVLSPTFTLMNVYETTKDKKVKTFVHIDTYRLKNEQELLDIGAEDFVGQPDCVSVIEWPEKIENFLKNKKTIKINIRATGENDREIEVN